MREHSKTRLYEVLGVEPTATHDEIKAAYRRAISEVHPDRAGGDILLTQLINRAKHVLLDLDLRMAYDATGNEQPSPTEGIDLVVYAASKMIDGGPPGVPLVQGIQSILRDMRRRVESNRMEAESALLLARRRKATVKMDGEDDGQENPLKVLLDECCTEYEAIIEEMTDALEYIGLGMERLGAFYDTDLNGRELETGRLRAGKRLTAG